MTKKSPNSKSVDQFEIEKFNKLADTWWDAEGPMWPLHKLNALRVDYIVNVLVEHFRPGQKGSIHGLRLLDIGCGGGLLAEAMASRGATVHGVDIPENNIAIATQHAQGMDNPPRYEQTTAEDLQQRSEVYDVVLNMEVVEHVADLASFLSACNKLVRPGGLQIISTINRNPIAGFSAIFAAEYLLRWLPVGTHQYRKLVKPLELNRLLEQDGLRVVKSTGVSVNPFTRNMELTAWKLINYMVVAEKTEKQTRSL